MRIYTHRRLMPIVCGFALAPAFAACESSSSTDAASVSTAAVVSGVSVSLSANEWNATGYFMSIGDTCTAWADVDAWAPCLLGSCRADVDVVFGSTDPAVLSPGRLSMRTTQGRATITLRAIAPGSTDVGVFAQSSRGSRQVTVVAAPLPLDSLRVRWARLPDESVTEVITDAGGNLVSATLPIGGAVSLSITAYRGRPEVFLPLAFVSTDSTVAWPNLRCRAPSLDPNCGTAGTWVSGLAPGTATLTVSARNLQRSFVVTVAKKPGT